MQALGVAGFLPYLAIQISMYDFDIIPRPNVERSFYCLYEPAVCSAAAWTLTKLMFRCLGSLAGRLCLQSRKLPASVFSWLYMDVIYYEQTVYWKTKPQKFKITSEGSENFLNQLDTTFLLLGATTPNAAHGYSRLECSSQRSTSCFYWPKDQR